MIRSGVTWVPLHMGSSALAFTLAFQWIYFTVPCIRLWVSKTLCHCDDVSGMNCIMEEWFVWLTGVEVSTCGWWLLYSWHDRTTVE